MAGKADRPFRLLYRVCRAGRQAAEYCGKGDIVGVKGRVQSRTVEKEGKTEYLTEIIAEKVTFLSSRKEEETDETDE